ncbi:dihydroorotate dehydrogenase electron transfer subunit [Deltaproteobacteria bacterium OttesenSCG-928-M10]|nr:dihydroorotate dehydrogenase electron transfer subunit [Deltaproteobacteria bacterium OttesenSCG-928-M10]
MNQPYDIDAVITEGRVIENRPLAAATFLLTLDCPEVAAKAGPGSFVKIRSWPEPQEGGSPFLDRPLSVHRAAGGRLELLYRVVGPATRLLSRGRPGDRAKISGPLGRGLADHMPRPADMYLAAGGIGLAPMALTRDWLKAAGRPGKIFYGERNGAGQVDEKWLQTWAGDYTAVTEDGSGYGRAGLVTEPLAEALAAEPRPVFACGPTPMLAAVADLCGRFGVACLTSVEAGMACGFGVCLTCSLPLKDGGRFRVCREGPVMNGLTIDWPGVRS